MKVNGKDYPNLSPKKYGFMMIYGDFPKKIWIYGQDQ